MLGEIVNALVSSIHKRTEFSVFLKDIIFELVMSARTGIFGPSENMIWNPRDLEIHSAREYRTRDVRLLVFHVFPDHTTMFGKSLAMRDELSGYEVAVVTCLAYSSALHCLCLCLRVSMTSAVSFCLRFDGTMLIQMISGPVSRATP